MAKTIEDLFIYLRVVSDILLIVLAFFYSKRIGAKKDLLLIVFSCLFDAIYYFIGENISLSHEVVTYFYASFTIIEFLIFAAFLFLHIKHRGFKTFILLTSILFLVFNIFYTIYSEFKSIDSIPIGVETILIFIYCFYYLYEQMNDLSSTFIYHRYPFWIIIGLVIYLAGSLFIYVLANQVDRRTLDNYWFLTNALFIFKNILFAISIITYVKQAKNPRPEKLYPYLN